MTDGGQAHRAEGPTNKGAPSNPLALANLELITVRSFVATKGCVEWLLRIKKSLLKVFTEGRLILTFGLNCAILYYC